MSDQLDNNHLFETFAEVKYIEAIIHCPFLLCNQPKPHKHPVCPKCGAVGFGNILCQVCRFHKETDAAKFWLANEPASRLAVLLAKKVEYQRIERE